MWLRIFCVLLGVWCDYCVLTFFLYYFVSCLVTLLGFRFGLIWSILMVLEFYLLFRE